MKGRIYSYSKLVAYYILFVIISITFKLTERETMSRETHPTVPDEVLVKYIGRVGTIKHPMGKEIYFKVEVTGVRNSNFGRADCTVTPVSGHGSLNIILQKIDFDDEKEE